MQPQGNLTRQTYIGRSHPWWRKNYWVEVEVLNSWDTLLTFITSHKIKGQYLAIKRDVGVHLIHFEVQQREHRFWSQGIYAKHSQRSFYLAKLPTCKWGSWQSPTCENEIRWWV
jgi:hypothetical protein